MFIAEPDGERTLEIDQHLAKLWSGSSRLSFFDSRVVSHFLCPAPRSGALSYDAVDVCLSVEYIGPKSRTERPRKTKIGTEVAHVTCD